MDKEYLIREKPLKALLLFAFPMIIGNLFQQFYTMVDSVVVGRFVSENALAAVGASYSLTNVFISVFFQIAVHFSEKTIYFLTSLMTTTWVRLLIRLSGVITLLVMQ